jgi:hypothetical protein
LRRPLALATAACACVGRPLATDGRFYYNMSRLEGGFPELAAEMASGGLAIEGAATLGLAIAKPPPITPKAPEEYSVVVARTAPGSGQKRGAEFRVDDRLLFGDSHAYHDVVLNDLDSKTSVELRGSNHHLRWRRNGGECPFHFIHHDVIYRGAA